MKLKKGDKVWFPGQKQGYTVRTRNGRYIICTKPFNPKKTVMYTIIDMKQQIRGTEDLIFCMGFETDKQCEEAMRRLVNGESEISRRNRVPLVIEKIKDSREMKKRVNAPNK
jgi:hypothetical protein